MPLIVINLILHQMDVARVCLRQISAIIARHHCRQLLKGGVGGVKEKEGEVGAVCVIECCENGANCRIDFKRHQ